MDGLGYHNARVIELLKRDRTTADPNVKDQIYAELRQIFRKLCACDLSDPPYFG